MVIYLNRFEIDCYVCRRQWSYSPEGRAYGIPVYEDVVLADEDEGEWAGQAVCPRCYFVVRGMLTERSARDSLRVREVRRVLE